MRCHCILSWCINNKYKIPVTFYSGMEYDYTTFVHEESGMILYDVYELDIGTEHRKEFMDPITMDEKRFRKYFDNRRDVRDQKLKELLSL